MIKKTLFILSFAIIIFLGFQLITHYKSKEEYVPQWGDANNPITTPSGDEFAFMVSEYFRKQEINRNKRNAKEAQHIARPHTRNFAQLHASSFINSNNAFALNMFERLRTQNGQHKNVIFSPYSLQSAFGMLYAGSKANTAKEIENVFGFTDASHTELKDTAYHMEHLSGVTLTSANSVWIHKDFPILDSYKRRIAEYNAEVLHADFVRQQQKSKKRINTWVKQKTNGLIKDLIESIHPDTRAILINALYFKGDWDKPFKKKLTHSDTFKAPNGNTNVDMMNQKDSFRYAHVENKFQILDMPYRGNNVSMMILLPEKDFDFSLEELTAWYASIETQKVDVFFPKFEIDTHYALAEDFKALGVVDAFDIDNADFRGISNEPLFIKEVIHKAVVKVNETGTEAAAASAIFALVTSALDESKPIVFRADRPFVFLIYDKPTKTILFIGLLNTP